MVLASSRRPFLCRLCGVVWARLPLHTHALYGFICQLWSSMHYLLSSQSLAESGSHTRGTQASDRHGAGARRPKRNYGKNRTTR